MQNTVLNSIHKKAVARKFSQVASRYNEYSILYQEIGRQLIERLACLEIFPSSIVDLGCGTRHFSKILKSTYPKADIFALDLSDEMLNHSNTNDNDNEFKEDFYKIGGDAEKIPLANKSMDVIFANAILPWCYDWNQLFLEIKRVLKPNGVLLFSSFGPDTLLELQTIFSEKFNKLIDKTFNESMDNLKIFNTVFQDMHQLGDLLLKCGFKNPVVDRDYINLHYQTINELLLDLKFSGGSFLLAQEGIINNINNVNKQSVLKRKLSFQKIKTCYENFRNESGYLPATIEVIFGIAHVFGNKDTCIEDDDFDEEPKFIPIREPTYR